MNPELEAAVRAVEARAGRRRSPTRREARAVLLILGVPSIAGREEELAEAANRLGRLPEPLRAAWASAVGEELAMACTEYVRSVDPRYLKHPQYDLPYTLEARRLLEVRMRAAGRLGLAADPASTAAVTRADALLERHTGTRIREWLAKGRENASG